MINPQYGDVLVRDDYCGQIVQPSSSWREAGVFLVDRFEAMRELEKEHGDAFYLNADNLHMNDVGHCCTAEQLARALLGGLIQADGEQGQPA
jgi:acyl-CoA thioesterase I